MRVRTETDTVNPRTGYLEYYNPSGGVFGTRNSMDGLMKLNDLVFDNCVIVGFSRDAARQTLTLTFEAYDSTTTSQQPDLYILECSSVSDVQLRFTQEFPADLNRPYAPGGNDQRANEIYELRRDASGTIHVRADMLEGSFHCQEFRFLRVIEEVEASP